MAELWQFAVVGLTAGGAYALTALGVVTVYKGSGVLNFAQGAIGMAGAYAFWEVHQNGDGWPLLPSMVVGLGVGALIGLAVYVLIIRLMVRKNATEVAKIIATLGVLLILQGGASYRYGADIKIVSPLFGGGRSITVFGAFMSMDTLVVLLLTIALAVALVAVFRWTRLGVTASALHTNHVAAAAIGISPHPTGMLTWALGGALGAMAGMLLLPLTGLAPTRLTLLVIPALAAGLLARFRSFTVTVAAGLAMGIAESVLTKYQVSPGLTRSIPFGVIVVALVFGGVSLPGRGHDVAARLPKLGAGIPKLRTTVVLAGAAVAAALLFSSPWAVAITTSSIVALLGLSIVVVTGYAGQLSLAPFALAGVSALIAAHAGTTWGFPFPAAFLAGVLAAAAVGLLIGAPAVRVRGVNLAIVTLGLALAIENTVLRATSLTGGVTGLRMSSVSLFGLDLEPGANPGRYAVFCVIITVVLALAVTNVRRSRAGRRFVAVRSNERGAAALGISVAGAKLGAFAVSAALAGVAGALTAYRFQFAVFSDFTVFRSILALGLTIVAGVGFVAGGVLTGVIATGGIGSYVFGDYLGFHRVDAFLPILIGVFVIDIMLRHPDGLVDMARTAKSRVGALVRRRLTGAEAEGHEVEAAPAGEPATVGSAKALVPVEFSARGNGQAAMGSTVLSAQGITVTYGTTTAVDEVSLDVTAGQVLGVIGPNGAGKTTLIDAITGFVPPRKGRIELAGTDVTRLRPAHRARRGLARTFQNLELFEDLTVTENLLAALDPRDTLAYVTSMARPGQSDLPPEAEMVAAMLGLADHLDVTASDLPQGVRRLVAIARVAVARPAVICLDEPAAGMNSPERKRAGEAFRSLARDLGAGVLLVEHNVDVVADVCDELVVLDFGQVIARGKTHHVLADPVVRQAYLGTGDAEEEQAEDEMGRVR